MNTQPPQVRPPGKRRPVFLWVFLAIQAVFLGWVVYAGVSAPRSGPSPGVGLQVGLWALTDVIIGVAYLIRQLPRGSR
jgi:hypothetical protein